MTVTEIRNDFQLQRFVFLLFQRQHVFYIAVVCINIWIKHDLIKIWESLDAA